MSVNIAEAKISLNKLIEDRNDSSRELAKVKDKLDELIDKRKYLSDIDQTNSQFREHGHNLNDLLKIIQLKEEIERINEKIECKSIQINDIQQMILEADKYEKIKHLFNNIDNIPEAKLVLKEVYNRCVECLLDSKLKQIEYNTSSNGMFTRVYVFTIRTGIKKINLFETIYKSNLKFHVYIKAKVILL